MLTNTKPCVGKVKFAEKKTSANGKDYWKFKFNQAKKQKDDTWANESWNCTAFSPVAEGEKIEVTEFSIEQREYTDKNGQKQIFYGMTAWKFKSDSAPSGFSGFSPADDDDTILPF